MSLNQQQKTIFIIVAIITLGIFMRFVYLESDPPDNLAQSAALFVDEGYKALGARNITLFGTNTQIPGDQYGGHTSNWFIFEIQKLLFKEFGVSLKVIRIPHILISIAAALLWFLFLSTRKKNKFNIFFMLILMLHPMMIFYSRSALYEMPSIFWWLISLTPLIIALKNLDNSNNHKAKSWGIAGIISLILFLPFGMGIKISYLLLFMLSSGAIFLTFLLQLEQVRSLLQSKKNRQMVFWGAGTLTLIVYITGWIIQPLSYMHRLIANPLRIFIKIFSNDLFFIQPFTFFIALIGAFVIIRQITKALDAKNNLAGQYLDFFVLILAIFGFLSTWFFHYDPPRYYLLMILPQLYLTAKGVVYIQTLKGSQIKTFLHKKPILSLTAIALFSYFTLGWLFRLLFSYSTTKSLLINLKVFANNNMILGGAIAIIILLVLFYSIRLFRSKIPPRISFKNIGLLLFAIYMAFFGHFLLYRTKERSKATTFLRSIIKKTDIVAGDWAPEVCFNLNVRATYSTFAKKKPSYNINNLTNFKPDYIIARYSRLHRFNKYLFSQQYLIKGKENYRIKLRQHDMGIWKLDWSKQEK